MNLEETKYPLQVLKATNRLICSSTKHWKVKFELEDSDWLLREKP